LVNCCKRTELQWLLNKVILQQHIYFAYYGAYSCVREFRHINTLKVLPESKLCDIAREIKKTANIDSCTRQSSICRGFKTIDDLIEQSMINIEQYIPILSNPSNSMKFLEQTFKLSCWGNGIGGKKWEEIAHHVRRCFDAEMPKLSPLMHIDKFWSLRHNNGTWFNKTYYNSSCSSVVTYLLDLRQRGKVDLLLSIASKVEPCLGRYRKYAPFTEPSDKEEIVEFFGNKRNYREADVFTMFLESVLAMYGLQDYTTSPCFLGTLETIKNYNNNEIIKTIDFYKINTNFHAFDMEEVITPVCSYKSLNLPRDGTWASLNVPSKRTIQETKMPEEAKTKPFEVTEKYDNKLQTWKISPLLSSLFNK
jgi:hypothetical protein